MTLGQRLDVTRAACEEALDNAPLSHAVAFVRQHRTDPDGMRDALLTIAKTQGVPPELASLARKFAASYGEAAAAAAMERAMLVTAGLAALPSIPSLRVDESVKHLLCKEILSYARPPSGSMERFSLQGQPFIAMSKIVSLRRMPAGQSHWEVSGLPRRWLARASPAQLPATLWFTFTRMKGLHPIFVGHLGGTTVRLGLLTEREALKSFCRTAIAVELQPEIKGLLVGSWLHSRETHRVSPHLAFMNRPYLECGGHYFDAGPSPEVEGFLAGDPARAELYRSGKYKPTFGVVMCSREQMIEWRRAHPDIEATLAVR